MHAQINALESKLAVRGNVPFGTPSANIVATAISMKKGNASANKDLASGGLDAFLKDGAVSLKEELELFAAYVLSKNALTTRWIPGPQKELDKAVSKTIDDYDYAWTLNKDLVRGTVVFKTEQELAALQALMLATCINTYGMFLLKKDQQKSVRDGGAMRSGYSGWNYVIQFKDHPAFGVEMQANTFEMMYAKMKKKDYCEHLKVSDTEYRQLQGKYRVPGGLGHALYDIQDIARSKVTPAEGDLARELALDYYDACRGQFRSPNSANVEQLNKRIQAFGSHLTSANAKDLWKHDVDACDWKGYPFLLTAHAENKPLVAKLSR
jgi:hypothetical protein